MGHFLKIALPLSILLHLVGIALLTPGFEQQNSEKELTFIEFDPDLGSRTDEKVGQISDAEKLRIKLEGIPGKNSRIADQNNGLRSNNRSNNKTNQDKDFEVTNIQNEKKQQELSITVRGEDANSYINRSGGMMAGLESNSSMLSRSSFSIQMELPSGKPLDKLNPEEEILYGFQRRTVETYISSFYKNIIKFTNENPQYVLRRDQYLTGRVTFNRNGQMKAIKIIRYSDEDRIQNFFINVLEGIALPNPPKMILNDANEFAFYFTLILRS